ncbi:MAG TPA: hypothetical protein P5048_03965 [Chlamydiales bacterium]|nr:hypothetical protein [Chlamydiales bacterium]
MYLIPITIALLLVVISFFVLVTLKKVESNALKVFGYVLAVFLWIFAIYILVPRFSGMHMNGQGMMNGKSHQKMMPKKK